MSTTRGCSVGDCDKPHFGKGYCNTHYYRVRRNGTLSLKTPDEIRRTKRASRPLTFCVIEECDRRASCMREGQRVCAMHGRRFDRNGTFAATRKFSSPNPDKRKCEVSGCDALEDGSAGMCKLHDTRYRRHGDPTRVIHQRDRALPRGEDHPSWNAEGSYSTAHQRLRLLRGRASTHACIRCSNIASHWAYQHGATDEKFERVSGYLVPYSMSADAYAPMCVPCHKRFDLEMLNGKSAT